MSSSSNNNTKYNPNKVITEANDKLTTGDYGGGVFLFQSALLQWTDDAREDRTVDNGEAVATLWLAYTQYLIQGHQFKSASDAFEEAMDNCPHSGRIFAEAARHALERNKRTKAQNIYLRALSSPPSGSAPAISDEQDQDLLWNDFLEMKREDEPNLTLKELKQAVQDEFMAGRQNNEDVFNQKKAEDTDEEDPDQQHSEPTKKRAKLTTAGLDQGNKTHVVTQDEVEEMAGTIDLDELPEDIMLAWLSYDGPEAPQRPDITLFTPSPPKLADPTAKDILGIDLAIQLSQRLLEPSGTLVLETCRALWTLQAIKEKECQLLLQNAETVLLADHDQLESDLTARLAVAGAAADAVRRMNDNDRTKFQQSAQEKRRDIVKRNAWEIRKVLCAQQHVLSLLHVPGFVPVGPTIDPHEMDLQQRVAKFLHSSFFIRSKTGEAKHAAMLKAQLEKLKQQQLQQQLQQQQQQQPPHYSPVPDRGSTAPPMESLSPLPPSAYGGQQQQQQHPMQQQQHGGFGYAEYDMSQQLQPQPQPYYGGGGGMMTMMPPGTTPPMMPQQLPPPPHNMMMMMPLNQQQPPPPPPPPHNNNNPQFGGGGGGYYH